MKRIFLTMLGALAIVGSVHAEINQRMAIVCGDNEAAYFIANPESFDQSRVLRFIQGEAVSYGAQTAEEIDQFARMAWAEMRAKYSLLKSVAGHQPQ